MTRPAARLFAILLASLATPAIAQRMSDTPADRTEPGVTLRVWQVAEQPERIPQLAENQTPNLDERRDAIDYTQGDFGGLPATLVTAVLCELVVPTPGTYRFRLTSDDGARLFIGDALFISHDGRHAATAMESDPARLGVGVYPLRIDHFDAGGARVLKLEWMRPGSDRYEVVAAPHVRTERDLTRVTSPGVKRLVTTRRPGDRSFLNDVHPGWTLSTIRPPGFEPKVGAMCFLPDGRLIVGTFSPLQRDDRSLPDIDSKAPDGLYALTNLDAADPADIVVTRVATDLYEPMGLCVVDGVLYCANRKSVVRLLDTDADGFFETHETVGQGWEGWNYHQFAMGLVHKDGKLYTALSTAMAPPDWEGMEHNAGPNGPMRGCLVEIDMDTGDTRVVAGGLRTPNGLGLASDGSIIYLDNQGTWMPCNQLAELIPGRFYGHYNWTNFVPMLAERYPIGGHPSSYAARPRTPAAVLMPHNEVTNSPTQSLVIEHGPFAGQLLVGELTAGGVRRVFLERVNGQLQGALFRFTQGLESGINRMAWGPDGALYLGGMGAGGNWNWRGTQFGLQRLTPNGTDIFEMKAVRATPSGFAIEFTHPIDTAWLADADHFTVESWTYKPTGDYGGPKIDERPHRVARATPAEDGRSVTIDIDGLEPGRCYAIVTDPKNTDGEQIWSTEAWYTLNMIPRAAPVQRATLAGEPVSPDALGVGVLPPADAVTLIAKNSTPSMRYGTDPFRPAPLTQNDFRDGPDFITVGDGSGDLVSTTAFADARIHVEWLSPPGGAGQLAGNSGVYLQDRYEIQVLGTKPDAKPADNEAGGIYGVRAPDANASAGPGQWQAYDIFFHAPRFENGEKISDARVTVYWNGVLVHNDIAIPHPTGSRKAGGEQPGEGLDVQTGPLRLQDHASAAEGPVRYRNTWIAPLDTPSYTPGAWTPLFAGGAESGWLVRGGRANYTLTDNALTGSSVPNTGNTFFTTARTYNDFELVYEFRTDPRLNSGVQVRSHVIGGVDHRDGGLRGYQIEIDPTERAYSAGIYDEQRRGWLAPLHTAPDARRAFRPGDWNSVRVVALGPIIRTWINGVPAAEIFDAADASGHIGFQVHDVGTLEEPLRVEFRDARIRELTPVD